MLNSLFNIRGAFAVGGFVRDEIMGVKSKDLDFAVEVHPCSRDPFRDMVEWIEFGGGKVFVTTPEHLTARAQLPLGHMLRQIAPPHVSTFDFVVCRKDAPTGDGRRPDFVEPGTLADDLARRDFTVNAIARASDGSLIDPHGGVRDIEARLLRFVGDPTMRIGEDGLRVLRGFRFMLTKDLNPTPPTWEAMVSPFAADMLSRVAAERIGDELERMFAHDNLATLELLTNLPDGHIDAMFRDGLRLMPTFKGRGK